VQRRVRSPTAGRVCASTSSFLVLLSGSSLAICPVPCSHPCCLVRLCIAFRWLLTFLVLCTLCRDRPCSQLVEPQCRLCRHVGGSVDSGSVPAFEPVEPAWRLHSIGHSDPGVVGRPCHARCVHRCKQADSSAGVCCVRGHSRAVHVCAATLASTALPLLSQTLITHTPRVHSHSHSHSRSRTHTTVAHLRARC
jgi:hypothetical protein